MRHFFAPAVLAALSPHIGAAQDWVMPRADTAPQVEGPSSESESFERGIEDLMGGMLERFRPHLEGLASEMGRTMNEFQPTLNTLGSVVDDIANYTAPERLPNGDILIRRKPGAPPAPALDDLQKLLPDRPIDPDRDGEDLLQVPADEISL